MNDEIKFRKLPPVWFIKALNTFRHWLLLLNRRLFPANVVLYEQFQYFWLLPCLRVAAELDIAGLIGEKPLTIAELAKMTGSDPESLFRIMRALTSNGIFKLRKDGKYINSPMSKALVDGEGSLRYVIMQHLGRFNWSAFNELGYSVRTGEDAVQKVYGKRIYDYLAENREESELFDRSMTNLAELAIEPVLSAYDFSKYHTIADIGGGEGLLLSAILFKNTSVKGILSDLPEGLARAETILKKYNVSDRIKIIPGNFFESLPSGADLYLLKNILHNWSDEDCIRILKNIKGILPEKGTIVIMEMMIEEDNKPSFGKLIDIQMMVFMKKGKERTRREYEELLTKSGLKMTRIIPTISPLSLIEASSL
jgi:C-methyltransferase